MKNNGFNGALFLLFVLVGVANDRLALWLGLGLVLAGGSAVAGRARKKDRR